MMVETSIQPASRKTARGKRRGLQIAATAGLALATALGTAAAATAAPGSSGSSGPTVCENGATLASGTYQGLQVNGTCNVPDGAMVTIRGNVMVAAGGNFNAQSTAVVTITGGVTVGENANFSLGAEGGHNADVVKGAIKADNAYALQLLGTTINGAIMINGGQAVTCGYVPGSPRGGAPSNLAIKDNTIHGAVTVSGWTGCWFGFIRNNVHGAVTLTNNEGNGYIDRVGFNDSTEIVTNEIWGTLSCSGNTPPAQIGDSEGEANVVQGQTFGECKA